MEKGPSPAGNTSRQLTLHYLISLTHSKAPSVELAIVKDVGAPGAFDEAIKGVDAVAHTASPFHYNFTDPVKEMLEPAYNGTTNMLKAAAATPSVKRLVITSSFASMLDMSKGMNVGKTYNDDDWNPATWEEASKSDDKSFVYCASKAIAEKAAWDFVAKEKPQFALTTLCPPLVL